MSPKNPQQSPSKLHGQSPITFGPELNKNTNISLAWRNLRYEATNWFRREKIPILKRLTGFIEYHSLNGFMGPSGCGKTTLIRCLIGNFTSGLSPETEIYLNKDEKRRPVVGLIERAVHETIIGQLTVGEALRYAFLFKNGWSLRKQMVKHIASIIDELMLDPEVLNRRFDKCSGGEQKRVAIAQELMSLHHQPSLLFVDEPTTGLDSNSALVVMKCLRRLADYHKISVTISIHTPNSDIVHLFDKLYVLAKGGVCIYSGAPDLLNTNLKDQLGLDASCDDHDEDELEKPPIEEYLKIACMGMFNWILLSLLLGSTRSTLLTGTDSPKVRMLAERTMILENSRLMSNLDQMDFMSHGIPSNFKRFQMKDLIVEFIRLFHIMFVVNYKTVLAVWITLIYHFLVISTVFNGREIVRSQACCTFGSLNHSHHETHSDHSIMATLPSMTTIDSFADIGTDSSTNNKWITIDETTTILDEPSTKIHDDDCHENLKNSAYHDSFIMHQSMTTLFISSVAMGLACFLFVPIVNVFRSEHRNRWYSIASFYWSLTIIQLIESVLYVVTSTSMIYFTMDFLYLDDYRMNWRRFGYFLFFYWIEFLYMQSFGHFLLILAGDSIQIFMMLVQMLTTILFLFNGHFIILEQLGNPLAIKISNILATRFINNGVLYSFYGLDRCDDSATEYSVMLHKYSVDTDGVFTNLKTVLINMLIIRLLTLIFMWIRFSFNGKTPKMKPQTALIPIDYDNKSGKRNWDSTNKKMVYIKRIKSDEEIKFEQFCRGKIHIAWRSLSLFRVRTIRESPSVRKSFNPKLILRNLNGQFRFGTLNAVMGTSGSGKTSLLKVLNGRWKTWLSDETKFYISKYTPTKICFISQEISGHLLPGLTAKQSLIYAAKLKNIFEHRQQLDSAIDYEEIATDLLNELDIGHTASTFVEYCSDGERKRLALALELTSLRMPNLICIDEPTSGLDSNSAAVEIRCLKKMVQRHLITIIVSIHQPNTEILQLFDHVYCLARGGVCIYSGSPDKIGENLRMIPEIRLPEPCGCTVPTEELIKYSCLSYNDPLVQKLRILSDNKILNEAREELEKDLVRLPDGIQLNRPRFTVISFCFLFIRNLLYQKNYLWLETATYIALYLYHAFMLRFLFNPKIVLTSGCLSYEEDFNNLSPIRMQEQIDLVNNTCYTILMNVFFLLIFLVQSGFALTREFVYFFNEHRNGWYSTMAFYWMKSGYEILSLIPVIFIYCYVVDVFEPIRPGFYWWLVLLILLGSLVIQGQSHLFALVIGPNYIVLIVVTFANFFTWFVLSNCFNPVAEMHYGYQFMAQLSVMRFTNEALFQLQYGFGRCGRGELSAVLYKMMLPRDVQGQYFYHCLRMLLFQIVFYRSLVLVVLILKSNPRQNRRSRGQKIRALFRQQNQSDHFETIVPGLSALHQDFHVRQIDV